MNNLPKSRQSNLVVQEFENEVLVYDSKLNKAYCLNETARLVFESCDGVRTVTEISSLLAQKLKAKVTDEFIRLTVNDLQKNGLMEDTGFPDDPLSAQSRREMIKKVGLASMIALPLISSIVAPRAANAASLVNQTVFAACTSTSQCASGLNCSTCSFGSNCDGSTRCCRSVGFGRGSGAYITCAMSSTECSNNASQCCSGQSNFAADNCFFGQAGTGTCSCA